MFTRESDVMAMRDGVKTIALLGASHKPERPSYRVMSFLLRRGYDVIPVNPRLAGQMLQGKLVFADMASVPVPVDMVDVFRQSSALTEIVDEVIAMNIPNLWTQLGVVDIAACSRARDAGIRVVMDRCPAIEW